MTPLEGFLNIVGIVMFIGLSMWLGYLYLTSQDRID